MLFQNLILVALLSLNLSFATHVFAVHSFLLPSLVSNCRKRKALNLAHGSGTLVFELGVEEIATADGGDVEACVD
jgi:hypothetical protein